MFAQFTIWLKQQQFALIVIILQTTIILFTCNVSSHKTDRIQSELPLPALSCLLYCRLNSTINAFEEECLCLHEISINVNMLLSLLLFVYFVYICPCSVVLPVYLFIPFLSCTFVACLLLYPLFYTNVVSIFLFIRWSCKQVHCFCFGSFCLAF